MKIFLFGMSRAGKTSCAKILADNLNGVFFDTDLEVLNMTGKAPRTLYEEKGENVFRHYEAEALRSVLKKLEAPDRLGIVSTGGGIISNREAAAVLENAKNFDGFKYVFLDVNEDILFNRICTAAKKENTFPAFLGGKNVSAGEAKEKFSRIFKVRTAEYKKLCSYIVQADLLNELQTAETIAKIFKLPALV